MELVSEELKTLRSKPENSKISRKMMNKKQYIPLYMRTAEILSKKEAKLAEERKKHEEQKEALEKGLTFKPELFKKPEKFNTFEEFSESMTTWNRTKQEKIAKKQFLNLEKEVENHPFKPEINEKSKQILQRKGYSLEKRQLERKKQELEKNKPLFKPQLNPKTDRIVKEKKNRTNYLVEFLQSPEKSEKLNIQITTQGVEVFVKEAKTSLD